MKAVDAFLALTTEPPVRIATLEAVGANGVNTPGIASFTLHSLDDPNKFIKIAAIHSAHALGSDVWQQAVPIVSKLATDPSEDQQVRALADRELQISGSTPRH